MTDRLWLRYDRKGKQMTEDDRQDKLEEVTMSQPGISPLHFPEIV